jgi:hypothetical protein
LDLFPRQAIVKLQYLVNAHSVFQILENSSYGHPRPAKHPRTANFAWNTFDG